ncbi:MAG: amidohydrolase family protein, partial [Firmicutes bacterium]|nr:amidohydrolase family protein [Bacillota bacterium]
MSKTVFYNAKVYVDKGVYAGALYQEDGWIKAVGSTDEILALAAPDAEKIDCEGRTVIPGFNDSHMHLINLGKQMMVPNLAKCRDLEDIIQTCRKYLAEHPNCKGLQCQGWREDEWPEGHRRLPDKHDLDRISTEIPVAIVRGCEHAGAVNSVLLKNMGLDKDHHTIEGGEVVLGEDGEPNGYLKEAAIRAIYGFIPNLSDGELEEA